MTITTTTHPASGPGAIAGFTATCSLCGDSWSYSIESMVCAHSAKHPAYCHGVQS